MSNPFFDHPILNSPYEYPRGTGNSMTRASRPSRSSRAAAGPSSSRRSRSRRSERVSRATSRSSSTKAKGFRRRNSSTTRPRSSTRSAQHVDQWRSLPNPNDWQVTPETARLLQHWRHHQFSGVRPFFCQVEAVETAIWLTEVAPQLGKAGKRFLDHLADANNDANPELMRLALKLATGAGKTTVMAMLIAWQTINAVRRPDSKHFTRGFLVVTPGLTIKDRLRVLQPNDPDSYYARPRARARATCSTTSSGPRSSSPTTTPSSCASAWSSPRAAARCCRAAGEELNTLETEGQMLQRVMPDLMGMKNILVLNDEAHHCYREKPDEDDDEDLKGDDKKEAEKNNEAARLWISGLEAVNRKLGVAASSTSPRRRSSCAAPATPRARCSPGR